MDPTGDNGFDQWKNLILEGLKDCKVQGERTNKELIDLRIAFEGFSAGMKVKASVWGLLGGLLPAIGILLVIVLRLY